MEEDNSKKQDWKSFRFPKNITTAGRGGRLILGTGLFTLGFFRRRPFCLFFGITELLSAATAYSPIYDAYHIYQSRKPIDQGKNVEIPVEAPQTEEPDQLPVEVNEEMPKEKQE